MQNRYCSATSLAFLLVSCQSAPPLPAYPAECPSTQVAVSTVTLIEEQVILVQYRPSGCGQQMAALTLRRLDQPEAFDGYVALAGGVARGQTRPLFEGFLQMNADRSLTYSEPSNLREPPFERTLQPGEPGYDDLLVRVDGLVPGERKMVARAPSWLF